MYQRIIALAAAVTIIVFAAAGCGAGASENDLKGEGGTKAEGSVVENGTFNLALPGDPGQLDPATNQGSIATELFMFTYDTLATAARDGKMVPSLATKWTVRPKTVRFTIRQGATCSDGSPVTPSVVAANFEYLKDPNAQSQALGTLDFRAHADDVHHTVTIDFAEPVSFPIEAMQYIPIVCGKGLRDRGLLAHETSGSGPYVLTAAVPNDHYTLTRRSGYRWGPNGASTDERGLPRTIDMKVVANNTTAANLLLSGQLTAGVITGPDVVRLTRQNVPSVRQPSTIRQMFFNEASGHPTAELAVRKALMMALDRPGIAKVVGGEVAEGLLAPAVDPCRENLGSDIPSQDSEAAAHLLDQAGWVKGPGGVRVKDGKRLHLVVLDAADEGDAVAAAGELAAGAWRELGAEVRTRSLGETQFVQAMIEGGWDAAPLFPVGVTSPAQFVQAASGPAPPRGNNFGDVRNPKYDALVQQAMKASGPAACPAWEAANGALITRLDVVPMVTTDTVWFVTKEADLEVSSDGVIIPTSIRMHTG